MDRQYRMVLEAVEYDEYGDEDDSEKFEEFYIDQGVPIEDVLDGMWDLLNELNSRPKVSKSLKTVQPRRDAQGRFVSNKAKYSAKKSAPRRR